MEREKTLVLMLLDLCAFVYFQSKGDKERRALEEACWLAERYAMPEEKAYRDIMARLEREATDLETRSGGEDNGREDAFQQL